MAVVVERGRSLAQRTALRASMDGFHFAEPRWACEDYRHELGAACPT